MLKLILSAMILTTMFINAKAQTAIVQADLVLDQIENKAKSILDDAEYTANEAVNNAIQNLLFTLGRLRKEINSILSTGNSILTSQQETLFSNLKYTANEIFTNIEKQQGLLNTNINALGNIASNMIISKSDPIITTFSLPIIVPQSAKSYSVSFKGVKLNNKRNFLAIGNRRLPEEMILERSDGTISFVIPSDMIPENVDRVPLSLHLYKRNKKQTPQRFSINVIPEKVATAEIIYIQKVDCSVRHSREINLPDCKVGASGFSFPRTNDCSESITPLHDRIIDVNSINIYKYYDSQGNGKCELGVATRDLIPVSIHAESDHKPYGGGSTVRCRVTFVEIEEKSCDKELKRNITISYNNPLVFAIEDMDVIRAVVITYFNGKTELIDNLKEDNSLISYSFNKSSKTFAFSTNF